MTSSVLRKVSALTLAGAVAFGASACTSVSSSSGKSSAASASAGASSKASSASDSATGGSSSSAATSSESSSSAGGSDSSGGSGLVTGKVGQDVKTDKYTVKVNKVTDNAKSKYDFQTPDAGKRYVDVNLTVTNTGSDKKLTVSDYDIKAKLSDNTTPNSELASGIGTDLNSSGLFKGDSTTGDVVYQVPQGQKIQSLDIDLDSFSLDGGQTIRITLS